MDKKYYAVHKPYNVISQFTKENHDDITLADLDFKFPTDVYPVGRLDKDSEGLLLLTNDNQLKNRLLDPKFKHMKTYWAQVENVPTKAAIAELQSGVTIRVDKKDYKTLACKAKLLPAMEIAPRNPPIRERQNIPTAWIEITLNEGKNRQVRRMCAAVGFPVLRLIRMRIESIKLDNIGVGEILELTANEFKSFMNREKN